MVVGAVIALTGQNKVEAYAAVGGTGYFGGSWQTGDGDNYNYDVIYARSSGYNAIPSSVYSGTNAQNKAAFISWLDKYVTPGSAPTGHNQLGGSFIVNTLLGRGYSNNSRTVTSAMWDDLKERINRPDIQVYAVTQDPNAYSAYTSFNNYFGSSGDVFYAPWNAVARPLLIFKNTATGKIVGVIEIPCGNPLRDLPGLPAIPNSAPNLSAAATCTLLSGAAWDTDNFSASGPTYLNVQVYIDRPMGSGTRIANVTASATEANGHKHGYSVNISGYTKYSNRTFYVYARDIDPWGRYATPTAYTMRSVKAGPCNDSQCNGTTFPATMEVGVPQTFNTKVRMTYAWASPPYTVGNPAMHVTIWNPANATVFNSDVGFTHSGTLLTSNNVTFTPATPGVYRMQWSLRGQGLDITCPGPATTNYTTGRAAFLPYVSVYGGDIKAGSSPRVDSSNQPTGCAVTSNAGVYSWNTGAPSYSGAGASYAVMALGQIQDFASTQGSAGQPTRLSFANTTGKTNTPGGLFGGDAGSVAAVCNYISDLMPSTTLKTATPVTARGVSGQQELFMRGDVQIKGNVVYNGTGGWANLSAMPRFKLVVVGGNIFIDKDVTQLDGLYVAIPNSSGAGGNIFTCSIGGSAILTSSPTFYTDCDKKLTINGAFVAKSVQFLRTFGSMSKPNSSAEQFNYSPELWLPRTVNSVGSDYNSITGLPPVL